MAKLTGQQLLAVLAQVNKDTLDFKELWQGYLGDIPLPADHEIKNAVRRLHLQDLLDGIQSYATKLSQAEDEGREVNRPPTAKNVMSYICGAAWNITEKENPDKEFHPTDRRIRNAQAAQKEVQ
jgi:5,10-methylene-tetrahydrofolate dehydrogenase/methenyl tetrahydrofolate cyclohydrolase